MPAWQSLTVEVESSAAAALSDALLMQGALSASVEDALAGTPNERPVFDEPDSVAGSAAWTRARVAALFGAEIDAGQALARAANHVGLPATPSFVVDEVSDQDWVAHTRSQFTPINVSERLWIVPSWHAPPDPRAINVVLDPGLAFGTGSHPTTRLCLRWLEQRVVPGVRVLDYGCGSGILAIAALKLGAGETVGVDIDPNALDAARENAARNGVVAHWISADAALDFCADLVVANILARPLTMLAPLLAARCRSGGEIMLAGVLEEQADDVAATYRPWFEMSRFDVQDGWVGICGTRR
jgi:ribosomal protein L11 methyltransferase